MQDSSSPQRLQLEKELEAYKGRFINFTDPTGHSVFGYIYEISVWPDKQPPHELEVIFQLNQRRYTMSVEGFRDIFNKQL